MNAPAAPPAPASSYMRMLQAQRMAANVRGADGVPDPEPTPSRPLRAVTDDERPRRELTGTHRPPETVGDTLRLDAQGRASARKLVRALGWSPQSELAVWVDAGRGLLWVQVVELADTHDTDGNSCSCERCHTATSSPPELPGQTRQVGEPASVTARGELKLTRGPLAAIGAAPGAAVTAFAVPQLHAVALSAPARLLDLVLGADPAPAEPTNVTPLQARNSEELA